METKIDGSKQYTLGQKSLSRLDGVHDDLQKVVMLAIQITEIDFCILEGIRSQERQLMLFKSGASHTLQSRHLTGHAIDLGAWFDGEISWHWPHYDKIADAMEAAADALAIGIEWGGDWKQFKDGPHFQLPRHTHPA